MTQPEQPARRYSDEMLYRLDERVRLHIDWIEKEHIETKKRVKDLEDWQKSIEQPVHYAGMIIIGLVLAVFVEFCLWRLLSRLWPEAPEPPRP